MSMPARKLPVATLVLLLTVGSAAQAQDHSAHSMPMPIPKEPAVPAKGQAVPPEDPAPVDHSKMDHWNMDHSGMDMMTPVPARPAVQEGADKASDHSMLDHSNMDHSSIDHASMDHAGMEHSMTDHAPAMNSPMTASVPPVTAADRAAAFPDVIAHGMRDNDVHAYFVANRLEASDADAGTGLLWEAQAWIGTDTDRLWIRSEGERSGGRTEAADVELLYGRSISPWWDVVVGIRQDIDPGTSQSWAAVGVMGLAPQKFELAATAYVGQSGRTAARIEADYELLLTNRLILQPRLEANLFGKDDPFRSQGAGLSTVETGLRLRYEVTRRFAPYVGLAHERAFGRTASFRRRDGGDASDWRVVIGLRFWF